MCGFASPFNKPFPVAICFHYAPPGLHVAFICVEQCLRLPRGTFALQLACLPQCLSSAKSSASPRCHHARPPAWPIWVSWTPARAALNSALTAVLSKLGWVVEISSSKTAAGEWVSSFPMIGLVNNCLMCQVLTTTASYVPLVMSDTILSPNPRLSLSAFCLFR